MISSSPNLPLQVSLPLHRTPSLPPYAPRVSPLVISFSSQTTQAILADACLTLSFYIHTSLTLLSPTSSDLATLCTYLSPSSIVANTTLPPPEHFLALCEAQRATLSPSLNLLGDLPLPFLLLLVFKEFLAYLYLSTGVEPENPSCKLFEFIVASVALHVGIGVALFLPRSFAASLRGMAGEMVLHEWSWAVAGVVGAGLVCWRVVEKLSERRKEQWEVVEEKGAC